MKHEDSAGMRRSVEECGGVRRNGTKSSTGKARRLRHDFVSSTGACARMQLTLLRAVASGCCGSPCNFEDSLSSITVIWRFLFLDEDNVASLSLQTVLE